MAASPVPLTPRPRSLADKLQEIAGRSPVHLKAIESLADLVLADLKARERAEIKAATYQLPSRRL